VNVANVQLARRAVPSRPPEGPPIRLLIVDDSSVARAVLTRMVAGERGLEVVATAGSVAEALKVLHGVTVDIVLLDIQMPGGSGLEALPEIIAAGRGARVLIVSAGAEAGADTTIRALGLGAGDVMSKPASGLFGGNFAQGLTERLRRIGPVGSVERSAAAAPKRELVLREDKDWTPGCIAIGASTGGINAINDFVGQLPARTGVPILLTQHLPSLFMPYFARQVAVASGRAAVVVRDGETVEPDRIHIAPGDAHLRLVSRYGRVKVALDTTHAPSGCLPSVDPMLASVAEVYGREGVAVMLSGMGRDGLLGSRALVNSGGVVLAQDEGTSAIWGMPRAVVEAGLATSIRPPAELARQIAAQLESGAWK